MAVLAYDKWCRETDNVVFLAMGPGMHTCTMDCNFFFYEKNVYVCKYSRYIHTCSKKCSVQETEFGTMCSVTKNILAERHVNCYWDNSQTLLAVGSSRDKNTSYAQKLSYIQTALQKIFKGREREKIEFKINTRLYKKKGVHVNKVARSLNFYRTNWHQYYFLTLQHCKPADCRIVPSQENLTTLGVCICLFWESLFGKKIFNPRKVDIFVACCVSELSVGNLPIFPIIPWLQRCFSSKLVSLTCTATLGVSSRATTTMLSCIAASKLLFPVNVKFSSP
jgi:hypothetical protein